MKGRRPLDIEEVWAVLDKLRSWRDRCLFVTCLYTGARMHEALGLDLADVWLDGGAGIPANNGGNGGNGAGVPDDAAGGVRRQIVYWRRRTKGQRTSRVIDVHAELRRVLDRYIRQERGTEPGALFRAMQSGPSNRPDLRLSRTQASRIFRKAFDGAGLRERTGSHSLRKTFAQLLADDDQPLPVIQDLLGHANVQTTREYFRVSEASLAAAVHSGLPGVLNLEGLAPIPGDSTP